MSYDRSFRTWVEERFKRAGEEDKGLALGRKIANDAFSSGFADASQSHIHAVEEVRRAMMDLAAKMYKCYKEDREVILVGSEEGACQIEWELLHFLGISSGAGGNFQ